MFLVCESSIIAKWYGNNMKKRNIAEVLLIKEIKPTLNRQDQSIALRLFNQSEPNVYFSKLVKQQFI